MRSCFDLTSAASNDVNAFLLFLQNVGNLVMQIQHAGDGGLYAELIQDRQFGGLAYSLGLFHINAVQLEVPPSHYQTDYLPLSSAVVQRTPSASEANLTGIRRWRQDNALPEYR